MFTAIPTFFGRILFFIYENIANNNYGVALIIFAITTRFLMLPLALKQIKSSARMQELQPQMQEIQKKYKNDREKLNQEMMKFYQEHKYNPMSGCLPILIQMPIMISLFSVIRRPLTYMLRGYDSETITDLISKVPEDILIRGYEELSAVSFHGIMDLSFLGVNLGLVPTWRPEIIFGTDTMRIYLPLFLISVIAAITTYFSSKMMTAMRSKNDKKDKKDDPNAAMQKNMMLVAPFLTFFFSFQFPAGLGLYWTVGNLFQMVQQFLVNGVGKKNKKEA
ncbi:UNVERIFIED_CONTAM: YidC/Oxa1 family membrane protein insertase [Acetivibrio alkalicellulosi]